MSFKVGDRVVLDPDSSTNMKYGTHLVSNKKYTVKRVSKSGSCVEIKGYWGYFENNRFKLYKEETMKYKEGDIFTNGTYFMKVHMVGDSTVLCGTRFSHIVNASESRTVSAYTLRIR